MMGRMDLFARLLSLSLLAHLSSGTSGDFTLTPNNPFQFSETMAETRCGGSNGKRCIADVGLCNGNECVCKPPYAYGQGDFACYEFHTLGAEIRGKTALTFEKERFDFRFPCRYLLTDVTTNLKDSNGDVIGTCEFQVYGFNTIRKGKMLAVGFDAAASIKYTDGTEVERTTRNYGVFDGNVPIMHTLSSKTFETNGTSSNEDFDYEDTQNGVAMTLKGEANNRQVVLDAAQSCGLTVKFVPFDMDSVSNSARTPGVSVAVELGFNPVWGSQPEAVALSPAWGDARQLMYYREIGCTDSQSMAKRAFTSTVEQNAPWGAHAECQAMKPAFESCSGWNPLRKSMKSCFWMFEEESFMTCYDNKFNSEDLLDLFKECVSMHCGGSTSCLTVKQMIKDKGCDNLSPSIFRLDKFMNGDYCPETWRP